MSIGDTTALVAYWDIDTTIVSVGNYSTLLVPNNNHRVGLCFSCQDSTGVVVWPTTDVAAGIGIPLLAGSISTSVVWFYYHDVGGLVSQEWYAATANKDAVDVALIEILWKPE